MGAGSRFMRAINNNLIGIILAGGKSMRMRTNKALLPYKGKRLIDHMQQLLYNTGLTDIHVSGQIDGFNCIPDCLPEQGPVAGICSALTQLQPKFMTNFIFVPVDMPLLTPTLLKNLCQPDGTHTAACYQQLPLPLWLTYTQELQQLLTTKLAQPKPQLGAIKALLNSLTTKQLPISENTINCFVNTNTPQDWDRLVSF